MEYPNTNNEKTDVSRPALHIDWDFYSRFLEDSDATEADKQELLETLWSIVVAFVDLGFGVHPAQQADTDSSLVPSFDLLYSEKDQHLIQSRKAERVLEHVGGTKEES